MREAQRMEFEWVFRSTYPSVLRTTYLVLHDRGRAEEVTQDAFLRLSSGGGRPPHRTPGGVGTAGRVRAAIRQPTGRPGSAPAPAPDEAAA